VNLGDLDEISQCTYTKNTKTAGNAEIPPVALLGGRLKSKTVFYSKLAVLDATEVN